MSQSGEARRGRFASAAAAQIGAVGIEIAVGLGTIGVVAVRAVRIRSIRIRAVRAFTDIDQGKIVP